jgi:hypothetical protein
MALVLLGSSGKRDMALLRTRTRDPAEAEACPGRRARPFVR